MYALQLQLPEVEPPPRLIDRKLSVICTASEGTGGVFREGFAEFLAENWSIWLRFEFEANKVRERGRHQRYSARTIGEFIRHSTNLRETGGGFKINDCWWPSMARLYLQLHPDALGFFEIRERDKASPDEVAA